jgi:hypothetical protein
MRPLDCPDFNYAAHPDRATFLPRRTREVLVDLALGRLSTFDAAADSRPVHRRLFADLVPPEHDYYAGHYRGEPLRCLRYYDVHVPADPRVGYPHHSVLAAMRDVVRLIRAGIAALDTAQSLPNAHLGPEYKALYAVTFACQVLEVFFRVHPYADGNGHAGRFIVWAILGRYGYWPRRWPVEPRPPDPPYSDLVKRYRDGDKEPLEQYVLATIA